MRLALTIALCVGCAGSRPRPDQGTARIAWKEPHTEEEYLAARGDYDTLPVGVKDRAVGRALLLRYLTAQINRALDGHHLDEALTLLRQALTLFDAAELTNPGSEEALYKVAQRTERVL